MYKKFVQLICFIFILSGIFLLGGCGETGPGEYDDLAKCLNEKGVKLYGAYWCGHCKEQKEMFGSSFQYLDYIECDEKGENGNPAACEEAGIKGFPTWTFPNGSQLSGRQKFETLAGKADCPLEKSSETADVASTN